MSTAPVPEKRQSLEASAVEQGVKPVEDVDTLACPKLWDSDADFDAWMEWLRQIRSEGRQPWPSR